MSVIVFCPTEIERKAVARALRSAGMPGVRVVQTGIGKDAVVRAIADAAGDGDESLCVLAGVCGGLSITDDVPGIAAVLDEHGGRWIPRFAEPEGVTLLAVDRVVATPEAKRELAARTGAAIVDMETHAFAAECERRGFAWTVIRGVSDTPDEMLPSEVLGWVKPDGGTRTARAAWDLARHPSLVPHIVGVIRRANRVLPLVGKRVVEIASRWQTAGEAAGVIPMPVPMDAALVVLFGGTFDPPHLGHVLLPALVRDAVEARMGTAGRVWVVYVPTARSPHKADAPVASDADRLAMLRLAIGGVERTAIWEDETRRAAGADGASYTVETVERARAWLDASGRGSTVLRLLIGADQAGTFHRWREPRRIMRLAEPLVMCRGGSGGDAEAAFEALKTAGKWSDAEAEAWRERVMPVGRIEASSTEIRRLLASGQPEKAAEMMPSGVAEYVAKQGLYAAGGQG